MKSLNLIIALIALLSACSAPSPKERLIASFEEKYISTMNDPDSYEFVSFQFEDTLYLSGPEWRDWLIINEETREVLGEKSKANREAGEPQSYRARIKIRGNNAMGGKVLSSVLVYCDKELTEVFLPLK